MNLESSEDVLKASAKHRRYARFEVVTVVGFIVIIALGTLIAILTIPRQYSIANTTETIDCATRLQAQSIIALGDALAAPPAPNPQREAAVRAVRRAGRQLDRVDELC